MPRTMSPVAQPGSSGNTTMMPKTREAGSLAATTCVIVRDRAGTDDPEDRPSSHATRLTGSREWTSRNVSSEEPPREHESKHEIPADRDHT